MRTDVAETGGGRGRFVSKADRKKQRPLNRDLHAERNVAERFSCMEIRRIATTNTHTIFSTRLTVVRHLSSFEKLIESKLWYLLNVSRVIGSLKPGLVVSDSVSQIRAAKVASQPAKVPCHGL